MIWYDIPDFPGYRINLQGEVLSLKHSTPLTLKSWVTEGYERVMLRQEKRYVNCKIHILLARTFMGPCPPGMQTCHNNGNSLDNRLSNLRYDTASENNYDQVRHGTHPEASRDACDQGHKFTPENTMRRKSRNGNNVRKCKECHRITTARYRARRKAGLTPTPPKPRTKINGG